MGFLDRFRREKEEEKPVKLGINEIDDWFSREFSSRISDSEQKAGELRELVMKNFLDIKRSATILELVKFEGKEKVHSAANMVKELFVNRAYNSIRSIESLSLGNDYSGMLDFHKNVSKTLTDMTSLTPKQMVLLSTYFKNESENVIRDIKKTQDKLNELKRFLDSDGRFLFLEHDIRLKKNEILDSEAKSKKLAKQEKNLNARMNDLEAKRRNDIQELERFTKSSEYTDMEKLNEKIERISKERNDLEQLIRNEISQIERPLKKLDYLVSKDYMLSKEQEKFLEKFIEKPFETLLLEGGETILRDILNVINSLVQEDKLSLKAKEAEKVEGMTKKLGKDIPELKEAYIRISREIGEMEKEREGYQDLVRQKKQLEEGIKSKSEEIKDIRDEIKKTLQEIESLKEGIKAMRKEIEDSILRDTEKRVIVA